MKLIVVILFAIATLKSCIANASAVGVCHFCPVDSTTADAACNCFGFYGNIKVVKGRGYCCRPLENTMAKFDCNNGIIGCFSTTQM